MLRNVLFFYLYLFVVVFFIEYLISVYIIDLSYCTFCCFKEKKKSMSDRLEAAIVKANYIFRTSLCFSDRIW